MLVLPGVTGKFLSYIPITIFTTLLASLFLSLTVNNAMFARFNKKWNYYYEEDESSEMIMSENDRALLEEERKGKQVKQRTTEPWFEKFINKYVIVPYIHLLKKTLSRKRWRKLAVRAPVGLLFLTFIVLSPSIGFKLFPSGDNPFLNYAIEGKQGQTTDSMAVAVSGVDAIIADIPEIKTYEININKDTANLGLVLVDKEDRKRDSFEVEEEISQRLHYLREIGYKVEGKVEAGGPPVGKAIGVKLIAEDTSQLQELKNVSKDFEAFIESITGSVNVTNSSSENPGQFSVAFDKQKLAQLGLTPQDVQSELYAAINGQKAGNINLENTERDIVVKVKTFDDAFSPDQLRSHTIQTRKGPVSVAEVGEISLDPALASIQRSE